MSLQQRSMLRQELSLTHTLGEPMGKLRGISYTLEDSLAVIEKLIQKFLWTLQNSDLRESISSVLSDQDLKTMVLEHSLLLSFPSKKNFDSFVYHYLFHLILKQQDSPENMLMDSEDKLTKWDESAFIMAFENRSWLENDVAISKALIVSQKSKAWSWLIKKLGIYTTLLNRVDDDMRLISKNISEVLRFFLMTKVKKNETESFDPSILNFLRETVILDQMTEFSSERILKRFLNTLPAFQPRNEQDNRKTLQNSIANLIGEFMLISLGIISPDMFKLYKFSLSEDKIDTLIKNTDYTKGELVQIFKHYNLRGMNGEPIFYNRRFTKNQIPSKESDSLVKDFLEKIKNHSTQLFEGFWYEALEQSIIQTKRDKNLDAQEKQDAIVEEINNRFADETFIKTMAKTLANYRYKDTYALIQINKM